MNYINPIKLDSVVDPIIRDPAGSESIFIYNPYLFNLLKFEGYTQRYIYIFDLGLNLGFPELFFRRLALGMIRRYPGHDATEFNDVEKVCNSLGLGKFELNLDYFFRLRKKISEDSGTGIAVLFLNFQEYEKLEKFIGPTFEDDLDSIKSVPGIIYVLNTLSLDKLKHLSIFEGVLPGFELERYSMEDVKSLLSGKVNDSDITSSIFNISFGNPYVLENFIKEYEPGEDHKFYLYKFIELFYERITFLISGDVSFKSIFTIFSYHSKLKLNDFSLILNKKPGVIQTYLRRLMKYNLITKTDKEYTFNFPEITGWLKKKLEIEGSIEFKKYKRADMKRPSKKKEKKIHFPEIPDYF